MSPLIADFVEEMNKDNELNNWTVALIGKERDDEANEKAVGGYKVTMLKRAPTTAHTDRYSIKTLISPRDQAIDLTKAEWDVVFLNQFADLEQGCAHGDARSLCFVGPGYDAAVVVR